MEWKHRIIISEILKLKKVYYFYEKKQMKIILFIMLCLPMFCIAQKTYNITGMAVNTTIQNLVPPDKIFKTKMTIIVSDSIFTTFFKGKISKYPIVKKANQNYFVINDGLKETTVTIGEMKSNKYSGFIIQESDKAVVTCFYK